MKTLEHQEYLALRAGATVIERDGHGEKVLQLADGTFLKLFRRKRILSSAAWYPYAQRFADNAAGLAERGVPCPRVIDVFRITSIERDAVHYHPLAGTTLRALARQGLAPDTAAELKQRFNRFIAELHGKGIYFRSLHLGNVVLMPEGPFGLIDISDLRIHRRPLGKLLRRRNLRRLQETPGECEWLEAE